MRVYTKFSLLFMIYLTGHASYFLFRAQLQSYIFFFRMFSPFCPFHWSLLFVLHHLFLSLLPRSFFCVLCCSLLSCLLAPLPIPTAVTFFFSQVTYFLFSFFLHHLYPLPPLDPLPDVWLTNRNPLVMRRYFLYIFFFLLRKSLFRPSQIRWIFVLLYLTVYSPS